MVNHFLGAAVDDMKHYAKPTQEKQPTQIIIHIVTNELPGNKSSDEIANQTVKFANSIKKSKNNVVISSIVSRKIDLTTMAKK